MDSEKLCLQLLAAESEEAVFKIIESSPEMSDAKNWCPIDDRENNWNQVCNQSSAAAKAATELMTNMTDAVLMRLAFEQGKLVRGKDGAVVLGPDAPTTMHDAVRQMAGEVIRGGKLTNVDNKKWLQDFATDNLVLGISGSRETTHKSSDVWPCYTFIDAGEGQHPHDFERTFLSFKDKNKADIPFVQGKYNMGSQGVLNYCGQHRFKLIISRRYDKSGPWGWTLVRRRPGDWNEFPVAEFFKPGGRNGGIPSFATKNITPLRNRAGKVFKKVEREVGTIVKLYSYFVREEFKNFIRFRDALNENLMETILPFRLIDLRYTPTHKRPEGVDERAFYGLEYHLLRDAKKRGEKPENGAGDVPERETDDQDEQEQEEDDEDALAEEDEARVGDVVEVESLENEELGEITITAIPVQGRRPEWLNRNRIFHVVNGQVQYKQTRGHLSQLRLKALMDRVVIIVDASNLSPAAHKQMWKGDRENILENHMGRRYMRTVDGAIENSPKLKALQHELIQENLSYVGKEENVDIFQQMVKSDPDLVMLLEGRDPTIKAPTITANPKPAPILQYSPTVFELFKPTAGQELKIPINKSAVVQARTDAPDGYFQRSENRGQLQISDPKLKRKFVVGKALDLGKLTIFLTPDARQLVVGEKFFVELVLTDPAIKQDLKQLLMISITDAVEEPKKPRKKRNREKKPEEPIPKEENEKLEYSLPPRQLLTKDGRLVFGEPTKKWPTGWDELEGGDIMESENAQVYRINVDNAYHLKHLKKQKLDSDKDLATQKYLWGMRISMIAIEKEVKKLEHRARTMPQRDADKVLDSIDEFRRMATRAAASVALYLTDVLPETLESKIVGPE